MNLAKKNTNYELMRIQSDEVTWLAMLDLAPEHRTAFLDGAFKGQASLRARLLEIAKNAEARGSFRGKPALDWMPETQMHGIKLGDRLGRYRLMERIGEGAWGASSNDGRYVFTWTIHHSS